MNDFNKIEIPDDISDGMSPARMAVLQWKAYLLVDDIIHKQYASGHKLLSVEEREYAYNLLKEYPFIFNDMEIEAAVMYVFAQMASSNHHLVVNPDNLDKYFKDLKKGTV